MVRPETLGWITCVGCVVSLLTTTSLAQAPATIRDREILPQPFDRQPFVQIAIPDWLQDTLGCGYTLSVMNTQQRELAVKHGVRLSEMGFVDPFYAYYDSKLLNRRNPHVTPDRLEKDIAEYKRLGVRILGVYPPCTMPCRLTMFLCAKRPSRSTTFRLPSMQIMP